MTSEATGVDTDGGGFWRSARVERTPGEDASWVHLFFFYGFVFIVGAGLLFPASLLVIANLISTTETALILEMPFSRLWLFCFIAIMPAAFAFGTELRFSIWRYIVISALLAGMVYFYTLRGSGGAATVIPIGSGLLGLAIAWFYRALWVGHFRIGKAQAEQDCKLGRIDCFQLH